MDPNRVNFIGNVDPHPSVLDREVYQARLEIDGKIRDLQNRLRQLKKQRKLLRQYSNSRILTELTR